jgi:YegS/Rv2252/BmrU family lipid kinase
MKIVFVANNRNNRLSKELLRLDEVCRRSDLGTVQFVSTLRQKHAVELARQATENRCDFLIAVGGDGTLHEVVNGVLQSNLPTNEYPTVGLLPLGSANDFSKTAGISNSIEALIEQIQSNSLKRIDLGKIILHQTRETRYFVNIASMGLSAEVVQKMEKSAGVFGPGFHYFINILKGFLTYRKKEVHCKGSSLEWRGRLLQLAVANGRYFGHGICIAPDSRIADGQFQVAIFGDLSLWDYLKNIGKLKKGIRIGDPQVQYYHAREVMLESDEECGIEADGEFVGLAPATISILPKAIRFLLPMDVN